MIRRSVGLSGCVLGAAMLGLTAHPALAEDTPGTAVQLPKAIQLEPLSNWNIDFAQNRCRLSRVFGTAEAPHLLFFEQAAPRSSFGVTFAGPEVERYKKARRIFIGAERDETLRRIDRPGRGDVANVGAAVILTSFSLGRFADPSENDPEKDEQTPRIRMAGIDLEEAATVDRFVLKKGKNVLSFETGDMHPPFQALNVCTSDLLREWGLDVEKHQAYIGPRWINQQAMVLRIQDAYPRKALLAYEGGIFRMRVIVEKDGSISDCHLEKSTVTDTLKSPACKVMKDAKFEPARDADGQPMRSFYATSITYAVSG